MKFSSGVWESRGGGEGGARGSGREAKGLDGRNICKYKQYTYLLEQTV